MEKKAAYLESLPKFEEERIEPPGTVIVDELP
jgi:hypothetical protein